MNGIDRANSPMPRLFADFASGKNHRSPLFVLVNENRPSAAAFMISLVGILANLAGMSPIPALDRKWLGFLGLAVAGAGIVAIVFSQFFMGDSWRMGVDSSENTNLVITGPFRIVRNPISAAMFVTLLGLSMMVPNAFALAGLLVLLVALEIQVRLVEEPYLRAVHSGQYDEYANRVGRFLPGIGRGS